MASFEEVKELAASEQGLCVVSTTRADGSVHSSVVNAGVIAHPVTGEECIALVARGAAYKLRRMRASGRASIAFRRGWQWAGVEGPAEIIERANPPAGVDYAKLLREVFTAAGGTHDDWDTYDQVMVEDQRTAIFIRPERVIGNG